VIEDFQVNNRTNKSVYSINKYYYSIPSVTSAEAISVS